MVTEKILSFGDKVKTIRKKYNLKQDELAGKEITRNLISLVEGDKVNLTQATAEIIIKNLNKIADQKNIEVTETVEYIMESELSQAEKIIDEYINELKNLFIYRDRSFCDTLKEAENFLIKCDIKCKKIKLYELAGDYYCKTQKYYKSILYYERARELIVKDRLNETLITILRKLSTVYIYIQKYYESIECAKFALNRFVDMSREYKSVFIYNSALCNKAIGNFNDALKDLETLENIIDKANKSKYLDILTAKAVCLKCLESYKQAIDTNNRILQLLNEDDTEKRIITHINIVNVYMVMEQSDKVKKEFEKVKNLLYCISSDFEYITDINFEIGNIYRYLNNIENAEKYYTKAIKTARQNKEYSLENNILCALIDIYIILEDAEKIDKLRLEFFNLSSRQDNINNTLMCKLINFYNEISCKDKVKEISNFVLELSM